MQKAQTSDGAVENRRIHTLETRQDPSVEGRGDLDSGPKGQDIADGVLAVSGLSWNATGSTVAVVYKYEIHDRFGH